MREANVISHFCCNNSPTKAIIQHIYLLSVLSNQIRKGHNFVTIDYKISWAHQNAFIRSKTAKSIGTCTCICKARKCLNEITLLTL